MDKRTEAALCLNAWIDGGDRLATILTQHNVGKKDVRMLVAGWLSVMQITDRAILQKIESRTQQILGEL